MKKAITCVILFISLFLTQDLLAQVSNKQRKKSAVKKSVVKPLPPPPPPVVVKEPTMEETRDWLQKKLNLYKPSISFTTSMKEKDKCEWTVEQAVFDTATNELLLTLKSDVRSVCYKDQLVSMVIDLALIDINKTTPVETSKQVLLFQQAQNIPFKLNYASGSQMSKTKVSIYSATLSFAKSPTYESNLTTRFGKALNKMSQFKGAKAKSETEAY